jgi:hypothetical protein
VIYLAVSEGKGKITEQELAKSLTDKLQPAAIKADYESNPNTNAFTDAEKSKLAGIEAGAQVNKIETIKRNGTTLTITSKSVDISVPTVINNLTSTDTANALSANQGKVLNDNLNSHTTNITHSFYGIASGTNTYAVTISNFSGLVDGANVRIKFTNGNTGACTLNINSLGAKSIKKPDGSDLASGEILAGQILNLTYNGSVFQLVSGGGGDYVQIDFNNYYTADDTVRKLSSPSSLSSDKYYLGGTTVSTNYALFAGGINGQGSRLSSVDAYNTNLTKTTPTNLGVNISNLCGGKVGNYGLFAGGYVTYYNSLIFAYDPSLTRSTVSTAVGRKDIVSATVGNYALFAGGDNGSYLDRVDSCSSTLTVNFITALSQPKVAFGGASVGNYAIFAGGVYGGNLSSVDAYNNSLTKTTPTSLSIARSGLGGASVGNYAIFAGGSGHDRFVDVYDNNLVKSTGPLLSTNRTNPLSCSIDNYALFASSTNSIDIYNANLVRSVTDGFSLERTYGASAALGRYALFGGGIQVSSVDAYESTVISYIPVTSGSKYKFTEASEQTATTATTLIYNQSITGYVKYKKGAI